MLVYSLLFLLLMLLVALFTSKINLKKTVEDFNRRDFILSNLIDALEEGFYFCDSEKRTEKFSPNLQVLLNTVFYSFDELSDFFEESLQLRKIFAEASHINQSFSLYLKAREAEIYCFCYGRSVIGEDNKVIGVLFWIQNITNYKLQVLSLKRKNTDLEQEVIKYRDTLDSIPYPIWRRGSDFKINLYNSFYFHCIKSGKTKEISDAFLNERKTLKGQMMINDYLIIQDDRRLYTLTESFSSNSPEFVGYGVDITQVEKLSNELNTCIAAQHDIFNNISSAISIYGSDGRIQFYNSAFKDLWQLSPKLLLSNPTHEELMSIIYNSGVLMDESSKIVHKQQHDSINQLSETTHEFLYFKNGRILKLLAIPYTFGRVIFIHEDIHEQK